MRVPLMVLLRELHHSVRDCGPNCERHCGIPLSPQVCGCLLYMYTSRSDRLHDSEDNDRQGQTCGQKLSSLASGDRRLCKSGPESDGQLQDRGCLAQFCVSEWRGAVLHS
jgi:hypothetical protein